MHRLVRIPIEILKLGVRSTQKRKWIKESKKVKKTRQCQSIYEPSFNADNCKGEDEDDLFESQLSLCNFAELVFVSDINISICEGGEHWMVWIWNRTIPFKWCSPQMIFIYYIDEDFLQNIYAQCIAFIIMRYALFTFKFWTFRIQSSFKEYILTNPVLSSRYSCVIGWINK